MTFTKIRRHFLAGIFLLLSGQLVLASSFPSMDDQASFEGELRQAALLTNLPNIKGSNHYLGLKISEALTFTKSGLLAVPDIRVSIYPNSGYNFWLQFSTWPAETPVFSVGTGAQVVFFSQDRRSEQAVGLSWSTIHGEMYSQRDINLHGIYSRVLETMEIGVVGILGMHHVLAERNSGVSSYDATLIHLTPYIKLMRNDSRHISITMPVSRDGIAFSAGFEWLLGMRE